jgi:hypothetical protein
MKNDITDPGVALHYIKATLAVWDYLRDREVKASWVQISKDLRSVFQAIDASYYNNRRTLLPAWDEWYVDWVHYHLRRTKDFVGMAIEDMNDVWDLQPNSAKKRSVKSMLNRLETSATQILVFDARDLVR